MGFRPASFFRKAAIGLLAAFLLLCLLEGLASMALLAWDIARESEPVAWDRNHTRPDRELGWANVPGLALRDFYAPGAHLHINGQGFRGLAETAAAVPAGRIRLLCSGDSFTHGFGVGDEEAWCRRLELLDGRIEAVNLGQSGYGLDQSYLWFERERRRYAHDVHLFTFAWVDFDRLRRDRLFGLGKPLLRVEGQELRVVPPPPAAASAPWLWLARNADLFQRVRLVRLLRGALDRIQIGDQEGYRMSVSEARAVAARIFEELVRAGAAGGAELVLVYLPMAGEYEALSPQPWRLFARAEAARLGIDFIDLAEAVRSLPAERVRGLFIRAGELPFPGAAGHYTPAGNALIARLLFERLRSIPGIAARLARAGR